MRKSSPVRRRRNDAGEGSGGSLASGVVVANTACPGMAPGERRPANLAGHAWHECETPVADRAPVLPPPARSGPGAVCRPLEAASIARAVAAATSVLPARLNAPQAPGRRATGQESLRTRTPRFIPRT